MGYITKLEDLKRIFEHIPIGITYAGKDFRVHYMNSYLLEKFRWTIEHVRGKHCYELAAELRGEKKKGLKPCSHCHVPEAIAKKEIRTFVNEITSGLIIENTVVPVMDDSGEVIGAVELLQDITERKRTEIALREERDKAQRYLDIAGVMIVALDSDQKVTLINKRGCEILGYKEEDIIGKNWFDVFIPKRIRDQVKAVFNKLMTGQIEPVEYFENPVLTKGGEERIIAWHNTVLKDRTGDIIGTLSSGEDITEKVRMERQLREYSKKLEEKVERRTKELLETERFLESMFDAITDCISVVDREYRIVDANKSTLAVFGLKDKREIIGKPCFEIFAKKENVCEWCKCKACFDTGKPLYSCVEIPNEGNGATYWDLYTYPLFDKKGNVTRIIEVAKDVTERKRAEEKYRKVIETSPDAMFLVDRKSGKIVDINAATCELLGYSKSEIIGKPAGAHIVQSQAKAFKEMLKKYKKIGRASGEYELRRKDGSMVPIEFRGSAFGEYLLAFARDVTERKRAEEEIIKYRERLEEMVYERTKEVIRQKELTERITEGIEEGLLLLSKDLRIQWVNRKLKEQSGYTEEEILGKHCYEITHGRERKCKPPHEMCPIDVVLETGKTASEVHIHYDKDGNRFYVEVTAYPLKENGEVTGYIHLSRDITERVKSEQEIKRLKEFNENIVENAPVGIFTADTRGKITSVNTALLQILGSPSKEETMKFNVLEVPTLMAVGLDKFFGRVLRKGESFDIETEYTSVWGKKSYVRISSIPLREDGKIIGLLALVEDITERKKSEQEIKRLMEFNENIVQSMEEGILIENDEGYITFVNPRMIQMLGCTKEELLGRHWSEIFSPDYERRVREENSRLREGHKTRFEASIDLGDAELQVMVSATPLMEGELYVGNLKVFVDITERKEAEERLRHKALKYKIEWGKSYLVSEKTLDKGRDIFIDLMQAGFRGMVLSRTPPEELGEFIDEGVEVLWFSEKGKGRDVIPPQLNLVRKRVEDFASRNSVVLLDRLDYLIVQNGFNEVLKLLQELNELAYTSKAILMIVIDPDTLSKQELSLLKKEFSGVEAKYQVELEEGLLEILKFVKKENDAGRKPVHKDVARAFGITRPTAVKRLKELKVRGLLLDQKRGRYKALEVTEKGKNML